MDMPAVNQLLSSVDGDLHQLNPEEFLVAEDVDGAVIGCGRLRPYPAFCEIASLAVGESARTRGLGRAIVAGLLDRYPGTVHLMCEDRLVDFFKSFGFRPVPQEDMPQGLRPKWQYYADKAGPMNIMVRSEA